MANWSHLALHFRLKKIFGVPKFHRAGQIYPTSDAVDGSEIRCVNLAIFVIHVKF